MDTDNKVMYTYSIWNTQSILATTYDDNSMKAIPYTVLLKC